MLDLESIRQYALAKPFVSESLPFDEHSLVFKVKDKMFMIMSLDDPDLGCNLKCEPEEALELRERYPEHIVPGYHMSKKHWNTVYAARPGLPAKLFWQLLDQSYALVVAKMPKKDRQDIEL